MSTFSVTPDMSTNQIKDLDGYKSWQGIKLLFDEEANGNATLSFTVTNNSKKTMENVMVELSSNTTYQSPINATPDADFCIRPGSSRTFTISLTVTDKSQTVSNPNFVLTVELTMLKASQVQSIAEHSANGISFSTNSSAHTAKLTNVTQPASASTAFASTGFEYEIPAVIKDASDKVYTVTEIKNGLTSSGPFYSVRSSLTKITFPDTLTSIGDYAFYNCTALSGELDLPHSLTYIGTCAFYGCSGFVDEDLTIGENVTYLGDYAFYNCAGLTGDLTILGAVGVWDGAFAGTGFTGDLYIGEKVRSLHNGTFYGLGFTGDLTLIGNASISINGSAFRNCKFEGTLTLGTNITTIPSSLFSGMSKLKGGVNLPNVKTIGSYAFNNCASLDGELVLGGNLTSIDSGAFSGCKNLKGSLNLSGIKTISSSVFYGCSSLDGTLTLGEGLTSIGDYAFQNCTNLKGSVFLPEGMTKIGRSIFENCSGFTGEISLPSNLTEIGYNAFKNCSGLTGEIVFPSTLTVIDDYAFYNCVGFTGEFNFPDSLKEIGYYAFYGCSGFVDEDLTIGENVTYLGEYAFYNCAGLTGDLTILGAVGVWDGTFAGTGFTGDLYIGEKVWALYNGTFSGLGFTGDLTVICNSSTSFNNAAFTNCKFTGTLTLGAGLTKIKSLLFSRLTKLTAIKVLATTPPVLEGSSEFDNTTCTIYVPSASLSAYQTATNWSEYASRMVGF